MSAEDRLRSGISVVVPCYRSEDSLEALVGQLAATLPGCADGYEAILVNDGSPDGTWALIERLAEARPAQFQASQYQATAGQLDAAEQGAAAIQVLDLGLQRFPDDETLLALIEEAKAAPEPGSEELEMLRSLGYVE